MYKSSVLYLTSPYLLSYYNCSKTLLVVCPPLIYLRLKTPGASLRQKPVFGLHFITLPIFLLVLLLILLIFLHRLLAHSLIYLFPIVPFVVQPLDALKVVEWNEIRDFWKPLKIVSGAEKSRLLYIL